jgi:hypothetical protein
VATGFKSGGRTKGTPNRAGQKTKEIVRRSLMRQVLDSSVTPLDVLCCRMRDEPLPNGRKVSDEQFAAAVAAAPYVHARLSAQIVKNLDPKAATPDAIESRVMELLTKGRTNVERLDAGRIVDGVGWSESEREA